MAIVAGTNAVGSPWETGAMLPLAPPMLPPMAPGSGAENQALSANLMANEIATALLFLLFELMSGPSAGGGYAPSLLGGLGSGAAPLTGGFAPSSSGGLSGSSGSTAVNTNFTPSGSGGGNESAMQWALSQEGISESKNPDAVRGYSQGRWEAWCADFVSTAFEKTGGSPWGHQASVAGILDWGQRNSGHFLSAAEARSDPGRIHSGDVVVWKQNGKSHVGIITKVNPNGTFDTIEGNTSDSVAQRKGYTLTDSQLTGFVRARGTF